MLKLTITKKIALSVIGIVIVSIVTMAWVTGRNLQRGFVQYLNDAQTQQLHTLGEELAEYYRRRGNFNMLRQNPRALHEILDRGIDSDRPGIDDDRGLPPRDRGAQPPPGRALKQHSLILGPRLSLTDEQGEPILGPPVPPRGIINPIMVDGRTVGTLSLVPIQNIAGTSEATFVRNQIHQIQWLAGVLIAISIALAIWLSRHLLRPVAALRKVTQSIARGDLQARVPVINQDELGQLSTHVNAMAQALESHDQQRRKVLADVSHELRTPLTVMRGEIEAMLDGIRKTDKAAIESLHAEVLHIGKLVDDLYQLALSDAGNLHYRLHEVDLTVLVSAVTGRFQPRATAAQLTLSVQLPPSAIAMQADPDRLTQVISNLLENSMRYTDAPGKIAVSLDLRAGVALLNIEDSVPGVPDEQHEKLFDRLYRVDQARTRQKGGSGLGLAICKALVTAHGGTIQAMPSSLGGLKVAIHLPATEKRRT